MIQNKKINTEKKILVAEGILVFGIFVYLFFATSPTQVYPLSGMIITENNFVFEIENGEQVLISTNEDFSNPIVLSKDADITLVPGTYYWKVKSFFRESEVQSFVIDSKAALNLYNRGEKKEIENSGNVDLDVTNKNSGITSSLDVGETKNVDEAIYEGVQK